MKFFEGAKVRIKSMGNITGTVQKVLDFDRYCVRIRRPLVNRITGKPVMSPMSQRQRFTVESHNLAEVELELSRAYLDGTANSDKGLTTLEQMDVDPETVAVVFIKYVREIHDISANWRCSCCGGSGYMRVPKALAEAAGLPIHAVRSWCDGVFDLKAKLIGAVEWTGAYNWQNTGLVKCTAGCKELPNVRGFKAREKVFGKYETRPVEVTVAYPQWTDGVVFDSRFREGTSVHHQCQLCAKAIPSGHLIPVEGRDSKHRAHGMYIGVDCAKKFTGYNVELEPLAGTTDVIIDIIEGAA